MQFSYVGYTMSQGVVKGNLEASSAADARLEMAQQGIKPIRLKQAKSSPTLQAVFPSLFKVGTGELVRFCRHLSSMLQSGGSLLRAIEMMRDETRNKSMQRVLASLLETVDQGGSLSDALRGHPDTFTPLFASVVEVGEYTGRLAPSLEQLAEIMEKEQEAKAKAMRTMMYPVAIVGLSLLTMGVLIQVALPPMLKVFERMGTDVPLVTRLVVGSFGWFRGNALQIGVGVLVLIIAIALVRRIPAVAYWMDGAQAKLPLLGPLTITSELSRFSRTMGLLLESGVPLATALGLGIGGCRNRVVRQAFLEAEESLISGHTLTEALKKFPILPNMFVELMMIGEESNSLPKTMNDSAMTYQKQHEQKLDGLLGMLEPASTLAVGAVVGLMAFSMFVPIYSGLNMFK